MAEFDPTPYKIGANKTLQVSEARVDLIHDLIAEGANIRCAALVKEGTDPINQIIEAGAADPIVGQVIGFWYPQDHAKAGVYENNPGTAIPAGAHCRVAAPQAGITSLFLLPDAEAVGVNDNLIPDAAGRVAGGAAVAGVRNIRALVAVTATDDDAVIMGVWE